MLQISEINNKEEFFQLKNNWDEALSKSVENHIFLSWEKMAPSVNLLDDDSSLKILIATDEGRIVGIAPFRRSTIKVKQNFGYQIIEPLTNGDTDYTGFILTDQNQKCITKFLEHLFKQKDWDFLYLPDLQQTSQTYELIKETRNIPKFEIEKGEVCPYIAIPKSREELHQNIDRNFDKKLRKSLKKLEYEHGQVQLKEYHEIGSLEHAIQILIEQHQKRWAAKGNPGRFNSNKAREITLQTAKYFEEKNWLKMFFLTVNDEPVAVELNLTYGKKMYCHLKGLDISYYKYRVGSLLTLKVLEECIKKGITEYDFMQGDEPYKFDWTNKYRRNINLKWVNNKLSSKMLYVSLKFLKQTKLDKPIMKFTSTIKGIASF